MGEYVFVFVSVVGGVIASVVSRVVVERKGRGLARVGWVGVWLVGRVVVSLACLVSRSVFLSCLPCLSCLSSL